MDGSRKLLMLQVKWDGLSSFFLCCSPRSGSFSQVKGWTLGVLWLDCLLSRYVLCSWIINCFWFPLLDMQFVLLSFMGILIVLMKFNPVNYLVSNKKNPQYPCKKWGNLSLLVWPFLARIIKTKNKKKSIKNQTTIAKVKQVHLKKIPPTPVSFCANMGMCGEVEESSFTDIAHFAMHLVVLWNLKKYYILEKGSKQEIN